MQVYQERDRAASNSYTLHKFCGVNDKLRMGNLLTKDGANTAGAIITQAEYAQLTRDILGGMFKGNVTFKRSASGMRTTCYLHFFGDTLIKAIASGCGYDVQSESMRLALVKLAKVAENAQNKELASELLQGFDDGKEWKRHFEAKGVFAAHIGG